MCYLYGLSFFFFFFQAEDGIRDGRVTGVQTCALPILAQWLSVLHPLSYATRGLRAALLEGTGVVGIAPELGVLLVLNLGLFPLSAYAFGRAVRVARSQGSLAHI